MSDLTPNEENMQRKTNKDTLNADKLVKFTAAHSDVVVDLISPMIEVAKRKLSNLNREKC